ncbi:MAG: rRNA (cytidine-2'-O-)-methyltransferase, partial [Pseudoalteromonas sp.]|nr:rRNA (cytidine-2'-O-)-methyltransferase [Pseudoalteromonas sp.]
LKQTLEDLKDQRPTLIVYESPKRIKKLLHAMLDILGDRNACLAREITKLHEEYIRAPLSEILNSLESRERIRGEIALFVSGSSGPAALNEDQIIALIKERMAHTELGTSALAKEISKKFNLSKKRIYDLILAL